MIKRFVDHKEREKPDDQKEMKVVFSGADQHRILLLKYLLKNQIGKDPSITGYKLMDDNIYYSTLLQIMGNEGYKNMFFSHFEKNKTSKEHFDKFEVDQKNNLIKYR